MTSVTTGIEKREFGGRESSPMKAERGPFCWVCRWRLQYLDKGCLFERWGQKSDHKGLEGCVISRNLRMVVL